VLLVSIQAYVFSVILTGIYVLTKNLIGVVIMHAFEDWIGVVMHEINFVYIFKLGGVTLIAVKPVDIFCRYTEGVQEEIVTMSQLISPSSALRSPILM
jgi:hypothetical protein